MKPLIEATGLVKRFGTTIALDGFDLSVSAGEVVGLAGLEGSGVATAMQMLATLSIFLWAFSFWLLLRGVVRQRYSYAPYLLLLAALLTYEIILPLLSLTVLYPLALRRWKSAGRTVR